jgi:DNA-binding transcriptional MerR regulator
MRMAELSSRSGVPIPTIKYYLREGLLQPGTATAATRAEYGESHVRRLRLIRALLEIGELPVTAIQRIVGALDDDTVSLHELIGRAQYALGPHVTPPAGDPDWQAAAAEVGALITELGWQITAGSPARALLSGALVALRRLDPARAGLSLNVYAEALGRLAVQEVATVDPPPGETDRAAVVETAVAGMVLYERVVIALRRLAQENASAQRFGRARAELPVPGPQRAPARRVRGALRAPVSSLPRQLTGRQAERLRMFPAVMLGQHLACLPGAVGDGALTDLAAHDGKLGDGHRKAAGARFTHHET